MYWVWNIDGEKLMDSRSILQVALPRLADELNVGDEGQRTSQDDF